MTSPPREIEVECPQCGQVYVDWYRPSINLTLDDFDEEYLEGATTSPATCCQVRRRVNGEMFGWSRRPLLYRSATSPDLGHWRRKASRQAKATPYERGRIRLPYKGGRLLVYCR